MTTPFLQNVNFDATKSVSVQNAKDGAGATQIYVLLKPGVGNNFQLRKANADDNLAEVVFSVDRSFIVQLTASLIAANAAYPGVGSY